MNLPRSSYSRGQLAAATGVKGETIRYYEKCGLLETPARSPGGHRIYTEGDAARLTFIRRCRQLGFSLSEIDGLIGLADGHKKTCQQVHQATAAHLGDVQDKIKDLRKIERRLKELVNKCENNSSADCPVINILFA